MKEKSVRVISLPYPHLTENRLSYPVDYVTAPIDDFLSNLVTMQRQKNLGDLS